MVLIKRISTSIIAFAVLLTLAGCTSFGSSILAEERVNYNTALQITNDEQLLLNLVRLRYLDSTAFIEVSSITAQSSFQSGIQGGRVPLPSISPMFGITGSLGYSTQPTLVYTPLQGEDFIRRLPDGFQSPVRERGSNFSGGQRQLLSLARVLVFEP